MRLDVQMTDAAIERAARDFIRNIVRGLPADAAPHVRAVLNDAGGVSSKGTGRGAAGPAAIAKSKAAKPEWQFDVRRDSNGLLTKVFASRVSS